MVLTTQEDLVVLWSIIGSSYGGRTSVLCPSFNIRRGKPTSSPSLRPPHMTDWPLHLGVYMSPDAQGTHLAVCEWLGFVARLALVEL